LRQQHQRNSNADTTFRLEFDAFLQANSAIAQQDLKSWVRDKYGLFGFDVSNTQSRARISPARSQGKPAPKS
jgi:hypothetical protein